MAGWMAGWIDGWMDRYLDRFRILEYMDLESQKERKKRMGNNI